MHTCNCPHEARSGCSVPECSHYVPPRPRHPPVDPDDVAAAMWLRSKDRKLYATWADVPDGVKGVWRGSYVAVSDALRAAGYLIIACED